MCSCATCCRTARSATGWTPATLHSTNRRLVHATLSGYGLVGPDAMRPGFDVTTFFGRGAITDAMTEPGGVAPMPRPAQGDHTTGIAMVAAILAGLRVAERTGEGPVVDVSLFATAAWTMASDLAPTLVDGRPVTKRDRHHLISPLANRFRCQDDRWIILNMPETRWWAPFCKTVERPEWLDDDRFGTVKDRFDNMPALTDLLDEVFATRTMAEWGRIFDEAGLIWGPASSIDELAADPQAAAVGIFPTIEHPDGDFRTVGAPDAHLRRRHPPARPGAGARRRHRGDPRRPRLQRGRGGRPRRRRRGRPGLARPAGELTSEQAGLGGSCRRRNSAAPADG